MLDASFDLAQIALAVVDLLRQRRQRQARRGAQAPQFHPKDIRLLSHEPPPPSATGAQRVPAAGESTVADY
ncbi:hypothetical protein GCM10022267_36760 [Lentzea roselyniae]|uniref:Uncharacterized protein n=1 Tax=Lentzea roselyniae TaxID=531940 RepID=A0ABP7B2A2_9PSEU